jgi:hypothetical protein
VIEVSDPTAPSIVAELSTSCYSQDLMLQGNILYMSFRDLFGPGSGLLSVDVSVPYAPFVTGGMGLGVGMAYGIDGAGDYAYQAAYNGGLNVFDVSDPYDPILVGTAQ